MIITEKQFLDEVKDHVLEVFRDDGVHRHIRLRKPGTMCYHFDLITWPGYLCFTGDMGTYVFRRLEDMFEFFRTDRRSAYLASKGLTLGVNFIYWAEKVEAGDRSSTGNGIKEFSIETAHASVKEYVESHTEGWAPDEDEEDEEVKAKALVRISSLQEELDSLIYSTSDQWEFVEAVRSFEHDGFEFVDFWEYGTEAYTYRFLWCCYALAFGIQKYDDSKVLEGTPA